MSYTGFPYGSWGGIGYGGITGTDYLALPGFIVLLDVKYKFAF